MNAADELAVEIVKFGESTYTFPVQSAPGVTVSSTDFDENLVPWDYFKKVDGKIGTWTVKTLPFVLNYRASDVVHNVVQLQLSATDANLKEVVADIAFTAE